MAKARRADGRGLDKTGLAKEVSFNFDQRGLVVTIPDQQGPVPPRLGPAAARGRGDHQCHSPGAGHAAQPGRRGGRHRQPAHHGGPYADNWALSAARAVAVVEDLISDHGIDPDRLQATGNSDTRPVVPNNSAQHQAENRRVQIVIFSTTVVTP